MRSAMQLPNPDPHGGKCASCHNPHVQKTPKEAWKSCTKAGCHTRPDTLTAFHKGLPPGVLESCSTCHKAHDFSLNGNDCGSCHQNIVGEMPPPPPGMRREGMQLVPDTGRVPEAHVPPEGATQISALPGGVRTGDGAAGGRGRTAGRSGFRAAGAHAGSAPG